MSDFTSFLSDPTYDSYAAADYSKQSYPSHIDAFESDIDSLAIDPSLEFTNLDAFDNTELLYYIRGDTPTTGAPSAFTLSTASDSPSSDSFSSYHTVAPSSLYSGHSFAEELDAVDTDMVRLGLTSESTYSAGMQYDSDTSSPGLSFAPGPAYGTVSEYGGPIRSRQPSSTMSEYYPHPSEYSRGFMPQPTVSPASTNSALGSPNYGQGQEENDSKKKHICPTCRRAFARQFNLKTHQQTHDPNRSKPFACKHSGCGRAFSRKHDLTRHQTSLHRTGAQLSEQPTGVANARSRCDQCGKSVEAGKALDCDCDDEK
ncbi:hypothetical protein EUX98_g8071 [Antrodiella citrinella]|uniref:C2H2-type domain-containing protein n=1 Tax=Antrodiella citrinella TaxID=2447956 RepID=A0A4S4MCA2_9APHY|nr:hypothetical protein EUX98_g8071 [Antrodiella citrinella]